MNRIESISRFIRMNESINQSNRIESNRIESSESNRVTSRMTRVSESSQSSQVEFLDRLTRLITPPHQCVFQPPSNLP
jgi:hypothetical protein